MYRDIIIDRYRSPRFGGTLPAPTHQAEGANLSCGDEILVSMQVDEQGTIQTVRHTGRSCAICTASADLLAESLEGKSLRHLNGLTGEEVQALLTIPLSPTRLKCALLPLETLKQAITEHAH